MNLSNIKLAGIDLDGTLLNDGKSLCEGAADIISDAKNRGIHIIPITGRPYLGIPDCVMELDAVEFCITSNGAQIIDAKGEKSIYSNTIPNEKAVKIIEILRSFPCLFEPFCDSVGYSEQHIFDFYMIRFKGTPLEGYFLDSRKICTGYDEIFSDKSKCADEFFVTCPDEKTRKELMHEIERLGNVQFCTHRDRFLEISEKGADKGNALKYICNYLGIDIRDSIAFGDGENDIPLLSAAGIGVAMQNAEPRLKPHADFIAKSNNENGVCEVLKSLF